MWVITTEGFYSGVRDKHDDTMIVVRARKREHLVALKRRVPAAGKIESHTGTDYPFRVRLSLAEWIRFCADHAADTIEYTNFKDAVRNKHDHDVYLRVWGVLHDLTPRKVRDAANRRWDRRYSRTRYRGQEPFDLTWEDR